MRLVSHHLHRDIPQSRQRFEFATLKVSLSQSLENSKSSESVSLPRSQSAPKSQSNRLPCPSTLQLAIALKWELDGDLVIFNFNFLFQFEFRLSRVAEQQQALGPHYFRRDDFPIIPAYSLVISWLKRNILADLLRSSGLIIHFIWQDAARCRGRICFLIIYSM